MIERKKETIHSLDFELDEFKALLDKSTDLILKQYKNLEQQKGFHAIPQKR